MEPVALWSCFAVLSVVGVYTVFKVMTDPLWR